MNIELDNVSKNFKNQTVLENVNLKLESGKIYGLVGRNGSGKSVLLKIMTGLMEPSDGIIKYGGVPLKKGQYAKDVGIVLDCIGFMPEYTAKENLLLLAKINKRIGEERISEILKQVGLEPDSKKVYRKFSLGMKQKLALSCALIHRPDVLFLDEPTTGVDPVSRSEFWDMLDRLKRQGITILVSTPYMDEASRCDRIALVRSGECLSIDTPVGIRTSFDRRLYAVRCASMYKLLGDLREFPDTNSCFAFGDAHHLTLRRDGEDVMRRLQEYLKGKGYADVSIERLEPSVEDCFMAL